MGDIEAGTIEGSMAGPIIPTGTDPFILIGVYGDGGSGDGLFWDGRMQAGRTMPTEDTHTSDGPIIRRVWPQLLRHTANQRSLNTGITVPTRKDIIRTLRTVRVVGQPWYPI